MTQGQVFKDELTPGLETGAQDAEDHQNQMTHGRTTLPTPPKNQAACRAMELSLPTADDLRHFTREFVAKLLVNLGQADAVAVS